MDVDPEVRKHALRSGVSVDTVADRESRIARYEAVRDRLNSRKGASNGGQSNGSANGRPTPPEPAYRPVGPLADRDAPGDAEGAGAFGQYDQYDSGPPRAHRREFGNFREAPRGRGADRRKPARVDSGPKIGDKTATGEEVPGPLDKIWDQTKDSIRKALAYAGFDVSGDADSLSEFEAEALVPQVATFFQRVGIGIDWALTHANARHEESDIWEFEDNEARQLAIIYLKRARKVGWMAQVARQVRHLEDVGDARAVAGIVGKRIAATAVFIPSNGGFKPWLK